MHKTSIVATRYAEDTGMCVATLTKAARHSSASRRRQLPPFGPYADRLLASNLDRLRGVPICQRRSRSMQYGVTLPGAIVQGPKWRVLNLQTSLQPMEVATVAARCYSLMLDCPNTHSNVGTPALIWVVPARGRWNDRKAPFKVF